MADKSYVSAVKVGDRQHLKCACEGCNNPANPGKQVHGSFMPGPDLVSEVDLTYNRIAKKVTLYLCDGCFSRVTDGTPLFAKGVYGALSQEQHHTKDEKGALRRGEFFINCDCPDCLDNKRKAGVLK